MEWLATRFMKRLFLVEASVNFREVCLLPAVNSMFSCAVFLRDFRIIIIIYEFAYLEISISSDLLYFSILPIF
jgi:hypothetical protein